MRVGHGKARKLDKDEDRAIKSPHIPFECTQLALTTYLNETLVKQAALVLCCCLF